MYIQPTDRCIVQIADADPTSSRVGFYVQTPRSPWYYAGSSHLWVFGLGAPGKVVVGK
jgi:hypothetical protein